MGLEALNQLLSSAHLDHLAGMLDPMLRIDSDVNQAFALMPCLRDSQPMQRSLRLLQGDPKAVALIRSRAVRPKLLLRDLLAMPRDSLGRVFGTLMQTLQHDPDSYSGANCFNALSSDADHVNHRTLVTHDLHHVLTGFNADPSAGSLLWLSGRP